MNSYIFITPPPVKAGYLSADRQAHLILRGGLQAIKILKQEKDTTCATVPFSKGDERSGGVMKKVNIKASDYMMIHA